MRRTILIFALLLIGCRADPPPPAPASPLAADPIDAPGLNHVFRVTDRIYSGGSPVGEVGFQSLKTLGVRTVISVDGAKPDIDIAKRYELRYVHLPVGYDGIGEDRAAALAAAVRDLPGPVYIHCHHGKHRGPTAVAVVVRQLDSKCTAAHAAAFLKQAGTDPRYTGLYAAAARPATPPATTPREFPQVAEIADLTRLMVGIDERWDALKSAHTAGWPTAGESAHDAVLLREHYREAARLSDPRPADFRRLLAEAEAAAGDLETALRDKGDVARPYQTSAALCTTCHKQFRDSPK